MGVSSREKILTAATRIAQARGYGGLNLRDLAQAVGIKAASLYHHFPNKADLAAAVARRYWEDSTEVLDALSAEFPNPIERLRRYSWTFRASLEADNRICLCSFMAAEYDDLPEAATVEIRRFADVNVAWLCDVLIQAGIVAPEAGEARAQAIFAAISGAQLMARGRADITLFDAAIENYRAAGLLPV